MGLHGHIRTGGDGRIYKDGITVTPTELQQIIEPPRGFNGISEVTVNPIPSQYKNTSDGNIESSDVVAGKIGYNANGKVVGSIVDRTDTPLTTYLESEHQVITFNAGKYKSHSVKLPNSVVHALSPGNIRYGVTILDVVGEFTEDIDDTGAVAAEIAAGKTAWVNGEEVVGTMTNTGAVTGSISNVSDSIVVPQGYTSGGTIAITAAEQAKIVTGNIRAGVSILGVNGKSSVVDTADGNVAAGDVMVGKVAYANGVRVSGTIANNGSVGATISTKASTVVVPAGYTTGGNIAIDTAEQNKIISSNIRSGVSILGVTGDTNVVNTTNGTATADKIAYGYSAYVKGNKIDGTAEFGGCDYYLITGDWLSYREDYVNDEVGKVEFGLPDECYLPNCITISDYALHNHRSCYHLYCEKLQDIGTYAFFDNRNIELIDAGELYSIGNGAFRNAPNFNTLIIRNTRAVCTLGNTAALSSSGIGQGTGYIYVPDDKVTDYQNATNFSAFASRIKGLSELPTT